MGDRRSWRDTMRRIALASIVIGVLLPIVPLLVWSFTYNWFFPNLYPQKWGLRAWQYVFSPSSRVGEALWTSSGLALVVVLLCLILGLPAARALALHRFRGRQLWSGCC